MPPGGECDKNDQYCPPEEPPPTCTLGGENGGGCPPGEMCVEGSSGPTCADCTYQSLENGGCACTPGSGTSQCPAGATCDPSGVCVPCPGSGTDVALILDNAANANQLKVGTNLIIPVEAFTSKAGEVVTIRVRDSRTTFKAIVSIDRTKSGGNITKESLLSLTKSPKDVIFAVVPDTSEFARSGSTVMTIQSSGSSSNGCGGVIAVPGGPSINIGGGISHE